MESKTEKCGVHSKIAFGQLILWKIIKTVAIRHQMSDFKAKMHQNPKFGWGSAPDHAEGAYTAPPDPLAGFKAAYF